METNKKTEVNPEHGDEVTDKLNVSFSMPACTNARPKVEKSGQSGKQHAVTRAPIGGSRDGGFVYRPRRRETSLISCKPFGRFDNSSGTAAVFAAFGIFGDSTTNCSPDGCLESGCGDVGIICYTSGGLDASTFIYCADCKCDEPMPVPVVQPVFSASMPSASHPAISDAIDS